MYERPPSFKPERSLGERALLIAPLLALVVSGGVLSFLLVAYVAEARDIGLTVLKGMARNEQAVASAATCCLAGAVLACQRRRWNPGLLIGLRLLLSLSFAFLLFTMRH